MRQVIGKFPQCGADMDGVTDPFKLLGNFVYVRILMARLSAKTGGLLLLPGPVV